MQLLDGKVDSLVDEDLQSSEIVYRIGCRLGFSKSCVLLPILYRERNRHYLPITKVLPRLDMIALRVDQLV